MAFVIRLFGLAVENVVGRKMDQRHVISRGPLTEDSDGVSIDGIGDAGLQLGLVHSGVRGGVDDEVRLDLLQALRDRVRFRQVEVPPVCEPQSGQRAQFLGESQPDLA